MANGFDLTPTIIAILAGLIVSVVGTLFLRHLSKQDKSHDDSKTAVLTINVIQESLEEYKKNANEKMENIVQNTDKKIDNLSVKIDRMLDKINVHDTDIKLHELRLKYLDNTSNYDIKRKNGDVK